MGDGMIVRVGRWDLSLPADDQNLQMAFDAFDLEP
jgi:hypothetical protein